MLSPPDATSRAGLARRRLQNQQRARWPWWKFAAANAKDLLEYLARKAVSIVWTSTVIMVLVVALQKVFDVGTLPIVDLVVMALIAEWLGWTAVVTDFLFRRQRV